MTVLTLQPLGHHIGAEVVGVGRQQLLTDDGMPGAILGALDANGVLVFRDLHLDDATQAAFCSNLGEVHLFPGHPVPGVSVISLDPEKTPIAEYLKGTFVDAP